jgi:autotransporter translocation and assembly factor TamB
VQLPLASAHAPKDRPRLENVRVGVVSAGDFRPLALDAHDADESTRTSAKGHDVELSVRLGDDVEIRRSSMLSATLEGQPTVSLQNGVSVGGQIRLRSGALQVQGKKFEIESGTVSFVGPDPTNPLVVVTAGWTAADGTRVLAEFSGLLRTGKVTLRSEPARSNDELLALILFGSADDTSGARYGDTPNAAAARAGSAAGTLATQGLSQGLDELTGLEISTKIDTSSEAVARPEVAVQLARTISLQIALVLGTPPPGANPDKTFATIAWRFLQQWSLQTTFGDQGSSFADVMWQFRY